MFVASIFDIAVKYGREVSEFRLNNRLFLDFRRMTISGVPFCFSVDAGEEHAETVFREMLSFIDALDPERCANEWLVKSGRVSSSHYRQAVAE